MRGLAKLFCGVTIALIVWRALPPAARRPLAPLTRRLAAELKPIWYVVSDRMKAPEPDPAAAQPSAARLAAPTGPARHHAVTAPAGNGEKAPMLSEKGVALDQEIRGSLGAPVLTADVEVDHTRSAANKLIVVAGTLAAIFMLAAWFRGDPDAKSLT